jgi:hypothetical protein
MSCKTLKNVAIREREEEEQGGITNAADTSSNKQDKNPNLLVSTILLSQS